MFNQSYCAQVYYTNIFWIIFLVICRQHKIPTLGFLIVTPRILIFVLMNYQIPSPNMSVVYKIDLDRYGMWKWAVEPQICFLKRFMDILERLLKYVTHEEAILPLFYIINHTVLEHYLSWTTLIVS